MQHDTPLVSCLMPSGNNLAETARAILCFQQQLWSNKELVVVDYGNADVMLLLEDLPENELHYIRYSDANEATYGSLWNTALEHSYGEFVIHWDPSDWYHPERITRQANPLMNGFQVSRSMGILLHLDHPEFVHHPYVDLPSGGYSGSMMYRKRDDIRYPETKKKSDRTFLSQWEDEVIETLDPDLAWLIIRTLTGARRSREYRQFMAGYRNNASDLAKLAWVKIRGRNMVSHPRFQLSPQAKESFGRYLQESKALGIITSIS